MFTGIIEEMGKVKSIAKGAKSATIEVSASKVIEDVRLGDSIATNGVCLTVKHFDRQSFKVDVMAETMRSSTFDHLKVGDYVNLERALRLSDRLGGHLVSGHIDGVGEIINREKEDNAVWLTIKVPQDMTKYMIKKGSIAIDGISLTIQSIISDVLKVSIIPHTSDVTTLLHLKPGNQVNIECDLIAKHTEKLLAFNENKQGIDFEYLTKMGF